MLLTRCPDCRTTFRITTEALHKADGQVRCGRCSNIFNAFADLRERADEPDAAPPSTDSAPGPAQAAAPPVSSSIPSPAPTPPVEASAKREGEHAVLEAAESRTHSQWHPPQAAVPDSGISADQVQAVLEIGGHVPVKHSIWTLEDIEEAPRDRGRRWQAGAALAAVLLVAQIIHHYRSDLARSATLGPTVQTVYSALGTSVVPRWDVHQYEVLDWVAAAEPSASGQGNLIITARIRNRGPHAQPYPHMHLRLLDRWEAAVGSRVFRPDEYLLAAIQASMPMQAGETADAQLIVVDPGPDAYGFELDVCVAGEAGLECAANNVFR